MKILLVAVNAKFIHTCPAIYSLRAYARAFASPLPQISLCEYTINDRYEDVLWGILEKKSDVIAFSTYIWNTDRIRRLIRDIRRVKGKEIGLWAGGPEAGYAPEPFLRDGVDLCMCGEGEESFTFLAELLEQSGHLPQPSDLTGQRGFAFLENGILKKTGLAPAIDMDRLPFLYDSLEAFENRILYYESSRGCPFACAYCLSGRERGIRHRNLSIVKKELSFFLEQRVAQVKFIDRTFNADSHHALAIWHYLRDHDNGVTNFHFEIEAGRMTEEEISLLRTLRPGLIQLEIGVQSANPQTLRSVHRSPSLEPVKALMAQLTPAQNINLHLDLIAGLPYEDLDSFKNSFCQVYALRPHQFQLGFLKLLPGTDLSDRQEEYSLNASPDAPYEILKTGWLSFEELGLLHHVSDAVEIYVNSQGFRHSLPLIEALFPDAFALFEALSGFLREKGYEGNQPSLQRRYSLLEEFVKERMKKQGDIETTVTTATAVVHVDDNEKEKEEDLIHEGENQETEPGKADQPSLSQILETIRFDRLLHVHGSRRMQAEEAFDLGNGRVLIRFDYLHPSPVHGEAAYEVIG